MYSLRDGPLCSRKRDQMNVNGESFHGSIKRTKQGDQTQAQLEKNTTIFYQRSKLENARVIKPDVQLQLDTKVCVYECKKINVYIYLYVHKKNEQNMFQLSFAAPHRVIWRSSDLRGPWAKSFFISKFHSEKYHEERMFKRQNFDQDPK